MALGGALDELEAAFAALRYQNEELTATCAALENEIGRLNADLVHEAADRADEVEAANCAKDAVLASERQARAAAEAAGRMKDEFLTTLSHELRTPLNVILGLAWRLRTGSMDDEARSRALETIERNARIQVQLIEELLAVSGIITGKLKLDSRPVDLGRVIGAASDTVRSAARAKGIQLILPAAPIEETVQGDRSRLQQVVWNLLSNAVKFTPPGGRVEISVETVAGRARIKIADTGVGISPEFLPHLFERFPQADSAAACPTGGLRLGLAIVRHLVELHGGEVRAESPGVGAGSIFTVDLPLAAHGPAKGERRRQWAQREPMPSPALGGIRVLLADDDDENRRWIVRMLDRLGADVTAVGSVQEAIDELTRRRPDVLLSELHLPGGDGYALIRQVHALDAAEVRTLPAAALTVYNRSADRVQALLAGYQMYLHKPVDWLELGAAVAVLAGRMHRSSSHGESTGQPPA